MLIKQNTMNIITNLISPKRSTPPQPALFVANNGHMDGEFGRASARHFQLLSAWRNNEDDHRVSERVIGPKKCLTNQKLSVADPFPHVGLRVPSAAAMGSGGRQHGAGLTHCQGTVPREVTLAFFQAFDGSVRSDSSRRSS